MFSSRDICDQVSLLSDSYCPAKKYIYKKKRIRWLGMFWIMAAGP